jgi:predicted transcriptional regulator
MTEAQKRNETCLLCGRQLRITRKHLNSAHGGITHDEYWRLVDEQLALDADGFLEDGTPFFGKLGEMAYDPDADRVQCHLCGDWFKWVAGLHLKYRHRSWSIDTYRAAFELSKEQTTVAASTRARYRAQTMVRLKAKKLGSPLNPETRGFQRET